jgi:hypothetical protein
MASFECKRDIKERVIIDGDASVVGVISAVQFRLTREPLYEVSYMHNGVAQAPWVEEWRLGDAPQ